MPAYVLSAGSLQLNVDVVQPVSSSGCDVKPSNYENFLYSLEELDSVCIEVPDVQIYKFSPDIFSGWIRMLTEEKLAERFIFLREYWEGTMELVAVRDQVNEIRPDIEVTNHNGPRNVMTWQVYSRRKKGGSPIP
ncbi:hypothetical protein L195_g048178 [Trifolium pratense]|uniref:Uncharacterized protein n=1 Tax=Trifolium pratense TaxID=57577 RepID=A0A2K3JKJ6_TRIPR|nr:hypothetical protein L195_g048178 [Trifolium pratense]